MKKRLALIILEFICGVVTLVFVWNWCLTNPGNNAQILIAIFAGLGVALCFTVFVKISTLPSLTFLKAFSENYQNIILTIICILLLIFRNELLRITIASGGASYLLTDSIITTITNYKNKA